MKYRHCIFLLFSFFNFFNDVNASELKIHQAVSDTFGCRDCIDWRVSGVCFWLNCGLTGCSIKSSVRVSHNIPDVLIAAYNGDSPIEGRNLIGQATDGAVAAAGTTTANFKNLDVIGNPAVSVFTSLWQTTGLWCDSEANPWQPYYLSSMGNRWPGVSWNTNYVEQISGIVERSRISDFGRLYPRCGWSIQSDDVKAAALSAVRGAHIVTRSNQSHIYQELNGSCGNRCWGPGEYDPQHSGTGKFQMLYPKAERFSEDLNSTKSDWSQGKYNDRKKYVWAMWRPYSCCQPVGKFLYSVNFQESLK